jgi:hypothetical protein
VLLCICCSLNQSDCGFEPKIIDNGDDFFSFCSRHSHTLNEKGAEFFVRFL